MNSNHSDGVSHDVATSARGGAQSGQPPRVSLTWLRFLKTVARVICRTYLHVHCEGIENVPREGACILVSNHFSGLDPFLIGIVIDRPIHYIAKIELYKGPIATWFLNSIGAIPLDRSSLDTSAVRTALKLLRRGALIGIAPEGTRSRTGEVLPFGHGATKLALRTHAPLLPAAIYGTRELMPPGAVYFRPGRVYIKFGQTFDLSESYHKPRTPELLEKSTAIIRHKVVELFEQIRVLPLN
jgi:1-acyl-sn-glycerol-3-phosphate acyltransferase